MPPSDPLSIVHVVTHQGVYRGGAVQACRMAMAQKSRGHKVKFVVYEDSADSQAQKDEHRASWGLLKQAGIEPAFLNYKRPFGFLELRRILNSQDVDIVHAHRDDALMACHFTTIFRKRPALVAQRGTIKQPPRFARALFASGHTRTVVSVSQSVKDSLCAEAHVDPEKVEVVYGSVDLDKFAPRSLDPQLKVELGIPAGTTIIGSLSAYREAKGFRHLLPASKNVMEDRSDVAAVFVGKNVGKKMKPLAQDLGIADRCHFAGHQEDIAKWISIMDFTVVAATKREGLSGVLRESLAMGVPVISTDCAGNREIVRDRETGLLVPVRDERALAEAMRWALANPDEMRAMAERGRKWVIENCSLERQAERLEDVYRSIL